MQIDNLDTIKFTVEKGEEFITMTFSNISDVQIGELRIKKERVDAFLSALKSIARENYGAYEAHEKLNAKISDKTSGQLQF